MFSSDSDKWLPPNKRLKLPARVNCGMTLSSARRSLSAIRYAVHRKTGEQFLLLYEDIARRKRPVQVIRFRPTPTIALPDSGR